MLNYPACKELTLFPPHDNCLLPLLLAYFEISMVLKHIAPIGVKSDQGSICSKTCVKRPLKIRQNKDLNDQW